MKDSLTLTHFIEHSQFLSVDPLFQSYPWYTPFQFAGNMPIWAIDLDGLEQYRVTFKPTDEGKAILVSITFVEVENRISHPEHGVEGVEYVDEFGSKSRLSDFKEGSAEQFLVSIPQTYSNERSFEDVLTGTRRDALGKFIGKNRRLKQISAKLVTVAQFDNASKKVLNYGNKIDFVAEELNKYPKLSVTLIGNTDKDPMRPYITKDDPDGNIRLSAERAETVKEELSNCVSKDTPIKTIGAGSSAADFSRKNSNDRNVQAVIYKEENL